MYKDMEPRDNQPASLKYYILFSELKNQSEVTEKQYEFHGSCILIILLVSRNIEEKA